MNGGAPTFLAARPCALGPLGTKSCWVFRNNFVHDNNNADVPSSGSADLASGNPGTCWHGNTDTSGTVSSAPADLQVTNAVCGTKGNSAALLGSDLTKQVQCATEVFGPCPPGVGTYPRGGEVHLLPLPAQTTMPDPCRRARQPLVPGHAGEPRSHAGRHARRRAGQGRAHVHRLTLVGRIRRRGRAGQGAVDPIWSYAHAS